MKSFIEKEKGSIFLVIIVMVFITSLSYSFYKTSILSSKGKLKQGKIIRIESKPRSRNSLYYVFYVKGKKYTGNKTLTLSEEGKKRYGKKNNTISILYLPSNPNINELGTINK
ncbi:hypothetical protein [Tenacibaculum ovolyticum]|uniref:hypothetical protein n=1 Tax=Tenacibaculum ovolyticum TaxID=104270 RepID=UPI003BA9FF94